ncbi:MAG: archaemetzincin [Planctomycetota bacterium]|nr:archaemetzincin [Planctomycetota bacterium]
MALVYEKPAAQESASSSSALAAQIELNPPAQAGASGSTGAPEPGNARERRAPGIGPTLSGDAADEVKSQVFARLDPLDAAGFTRMGRPRPGEWLSSFRESPQPMELYRMQRPVRPTPERRTIVLQPLGEFTPGQRKVLESMREYAEVFFQLPARLERTMPFPRGDEALEEQLVRIVPVGQRHGSYDRQYRAETILDRMLKTHLPADAVVYLGITMEDLWASNLAYVFGLGSFKDRVGVYGLCRYYPEFWGRARGPGDELKGLHRSCKVLNHEAGHMFGLSHCVFFHCSMNGSNSLPETDAAPIHFCPVCQRKLAWNIGYDPLKRFDALEAFYRAQGLSEDADWMKARIGNWKNLLDKQAVVEEEE